MLANYKDASSEFFLSPIDFNDRTNALFLEFKLLKLADIFKMQEVTFIFDFINMLINLKHFVCLNSQFNFMKNAPLVFHIPNAKKLQHLELTR